MAHPSTPETSDPLQLIGSLWSAESLFCADRILTADEQYALESRFLAAVKRAKPSLPEVAVKALQLKPALIIGRYPVIWKQGYQEAIKTLVNTLIRAKANAIRYTLGSFITHTTIIGAGEYGTIYRADLRSHPLVAIKSTMKVNCIASVQHGAVVGLCALNSLRHFIPTFVYTYGTLPSYFIPDRTEQGMVQVQDGHSKGCAVLLEHITYSTTLRKFIRMTRCTVTVLAEILLQVFNALHLAYVKVRFQHFDLHDENILIQILTEPTTITIFNDDDLDETKRTYLTTTHLARIIDFDLTKAVIPTTKGPIAVVPLLIIGNPSLAYQDDHPGYGIINLITSMAVSLERHRLDTRALDHGPLWPFLSALYLTVTEDFTLNQLMRQFYRKQHDQTISPHDQAINLRHLDNSNNRLLALRTLCKEWLSGSPFVIAPSSSEFVLEHFITEHFDGAVIPRSIIEVYTTIVVARRTRTLTPRKTVLWWLDTVDVLLLANEEYITWVNAISAWRRVISAGIPDNRTIGKLRDFMNQGRLWMRVVSALITSPPTLVTDLQGLLMGLDAHFVDWERYLKGLDRSAGTDIPSPTAALMPTVADSSPSLSEFSSEPDRSEVKNSITNSEMTGAPTGSWCSIS